MPMENKSLVEQLICSHDFPYLQPYFYNHPHALRCELGIGDTDAEYMANAEKRALDIFHILFPAGPDAMFFNYWIYDFSDSGDAEYLNCDADDDPEGIIENRIEVETEQIRFLSEYQFRYRHVTVENLPTYDDPDDPDYGKNRRNRVICFSDGKDFDYHALILRQFDGLLGHEISFVSFENECILSVYDDRGCDIVFAAPEKMRMFYDKLKPYFLKYDLEEMEARYRA